MNQTKLTNTELKGQLVEAKEQLTLMDVEHTKAMNRCEVLTQMNMSLEEDRRSLMDQVKIRVYVLTLFLHTKKQCLNQSAMRQLLQYLRLYGSTPNYWLLSDGIGTLDLGSGLILYLAAEATKAVIVFLVLCSKEIFIVIK